MSSAPFFPKFNRAGLGRKPASAQAILARKTRLTDSYCLDHLEQLFGGHLPSKVRNFKPEKGRNSRKRIFTPMLTYWAMLAQVLAPDTSCASAVSRVQALYVSEGLAAISSDTGAYCKARARLSIFFLFEILHWISAAVVRAADDFGSDSSPITCGRLLVMDGTSATLPDSKANREIYSYPSGQKEGCGFPKMYLLGLFHLRSGASLRMVKSATLRHDSALAWKLLPWLRKGDTLLADRAFCSYTFIHACEKLGVTVVMRLHQARKNEPGKSKRLGPGDELQTWQKPTKCPKGTTAAQFEALPAKLDIRVVCHQVEVRGHRPEPMYIATTKRDVGMDSAASIVALYLLRWKVELFFDDLKTSQSMETLRCESPHMLARELIMQLIAYNLVRMTMVQAEKQRPAAQEGSLSYKGTLTRITEWHTALWACQGAKKRQERYMELLRCVAEDVVPSRPGRREPRQIKRRSSKYPLMTKPRAEARLLPEPPKHSPKKSQKSKKVTKLLTEKKAA